MKKKDFTKTERIVTKAELFYEKIYIINNQKNIKSRK